MNPDLPWLEEELAAHSQWVRRLARSLVHDETAAEDLVQDTWVAALRRPPSDRRALRGWLGRVVRTLAWKQQRRASTVPIAGDEGEVPEGAPESELVERLELHRMLAEELRAIREPLRTTLLQRYFENRSAAEIAQQAGIPAATVRWRSQKGLEELRSRLDARFGGKRETWMSALAFALPSKGTVLGGSGVAIGERALMSTLVKISLGTALVVVGVFLVRPFVSSDAVDGSKTAALLRASGTESKAPGPPGLATASDRGGGRAAVDAAAPLSLEGSAKPDGTHARIVARFLDESGSPLSTAWLERYAKLGPEEPLPLLRAPASLDGVATLEFEPGAAEISFLFHVGAPGFLTSIQVAELTLGNVSHLGDVRLMRSATVGGRIVDAAGEPVSGVQVVTLPAHFGTKLGRAGEAYSLGLPGMPGGSVTSDPGGRFSIDNVVPGVIRVWGQLEGDQWACAGPFQLDPGSVKRDVLLVGTRPPQQAAPKYVIHGVVLDPGGRPVFKARVDAWLEHQTHASASTDEEGKFHLGVWELGLFELHVFPELENAYSALEVDDVVPGPEEHVLQFNPPRWMEFEVYAGGARCTNYALQGWCRGHGVERSQGREAGERLLVPNFEFRVDLSLPGCQPAHLGPFQPSTAPSSLRVDLVPGKLAGRVFARGQPVVGARVTLFAILDTSGARCDGFTSLVRPLRGPPSQSQPDGAFHLDLPSKGMYRIYVEAPGYARSEGAPLALDPDARVAELRFDLEQGGALEGYVRAPEGLDPSGTIVSANRGDGAPRTTRAGPGGRYRFERMTPGTWEIGQRDSELTPDRDWSRAGEPGEPSIRADVMIETGQTSHLDLDLHAVRPCVLKGRFFVNGTPAYAWSVDSCIHGPDAGSRSAEGEVHSDGTFALRLDPVGLWSLVLKSPVEMEWNMSIAATVQLGPGDNSWSLDLPVTRVDGRMLSPHGEWLQLTSHSEGIDWASVSFAVATDNTFTLPMVPAGACEIVTYVGEFPNQKPVVLARFSAIAGTTTHVDVP